MSGNCLQINQQPLIPTNPDIFNNNEYRDQSNNQSSLFPRAVSSAHTVAPCQPANLSLLEFSKKHRICKCCQHYLDEAREWLSLSCPDPQYLPRNQTKQPLSADTTAFQEPVAANGNNARQERSYGEYWQTHQTVLPDRK